MAYSISLKDKVAIVTGGGTGLGKAISTHLAECGAIVVIASIDKTSMIETEREIRKNGGQAISIETDVSDIKSIQSMVKKSINDIGGADILVNNAAIYPSHSIEEVSIEEWDKVFAVNLRGSFACVKSVLPYMKKKQWGRIINISSITFFNGDTNIIHYVSSKGGVIGFTRALARECGLWNVTVNSIAPGAFPTAAEEIHEDLAAYNKFVLENQSLKRRGTPEDIANATLFFASELSSFITGQTLLIDGGWAMN